MTLQRPQLIVPVFTIFMVITAATHADESVEPKPVLMTEHPLSEEQARTAQMAWADHLGVDAVFENSIGMQLCVIPPGTFPLGWDEERGDEGHHREVTLSQPYFIGRYEVTQGEWKRVMGPLRRERKVSAGDRFPMNGVNYAEAAEFCRKLTKLERDAGKLPEGYEYRLPTNAEFEFASRAGTLTRTYFGDTLTSLQANFDGTRPHVGAEPGPDLGRPAEVGSYPGNAWGLHDTVGNLSEWCLDWYRTELKGGVDPVQLLPAPDRPVAQRIAKGVGYEGRGRYCRSANRYWYAPDNRSGVVGFRPVLSKLHLDVFHQLTDGTQTDITQTWTRDGTNTRIWHKRDVKNRSCCVMLGLVESLPGEPSARPLTDRSHHTWAYDCLTDGRMLVQSKSPNRELGYYLMTPNKDGMPKFERIQCDLATTGTLERIHISPSETRVCFEFHSADAKPVGGNRTPKQTGFGSDVPGRTLYVADFDARQPAIANARPFANEEGKPVWYAWPRWSKDESAIVYQADGKVYRYNLASKTTTLTGGGSETSSNKSATKVATKSTDVSVAPERVMMTEQALSTEQARTVQKAWADHLGVDSIFENSIDMQFCVIPPGTFPMGWEERKGEDGPKVVTHSQPYFIGRYEVTQGEWERVMGPLGQHRKEVGDRLPVNGINHAEAAEFCRKLTGLDREAGKLPEGYEYRLPSDAELEYACRAGTLTLTYFGDKLNSTQANFDGREPLNKGEKGPFLNRLADVGSYPGNAWGLHDTYGSLYEWCFDWYHAQVKGGVDPVHLLPAPERLIPQRVRRGGAWKYAGRYCRSANRYYEAPENRSSVDGFRPVLSKLHLDAFHQLTDGKHTDFAQIWTREGTNTRIWHKKDLKTPNYFVMSGPVSRLPGESYAVPLTDGSHHTWAYDCLADGRILVQSNPQNQESGYFLMTSIKGETPKYESVQCDLAAEGILDRIRLSPSETQVCFEFQTGFEKDEQGRTLYVADFDATQPAITNARPFANEEGKPVWYAWPRWSKDESAIVYQADGKLHSYNLTSKTTTLAEGSFETSVEPVLVARSVSEGPKGKTVPQSPPLTSQATSASETSSNKSTTRVATKNSDDSGTPDQVLMTEQALSAEQARTVQKAWAAHIGFEVAFENSIGMQLRVIPPGTFRMSSPKADEGQRGPVEVTLSQAFLIGQFEVTQGEWERVMGPIERELDAGAGDRFPVYRVRHTEATEFCRKLTQLDRKAGKLPDGYEYRLPTDAEWEFACRAGTLTLTHFGDKMSSKLANYDGNRPFRDSEKGPNLNRAAEVGTYPTNAWGLHEIHGNLCEWCLDWYQHKVPGGVDPVQLEPVDWDKPPMVVRDCRWGYTGAYCHSANRYHAPPSAARPTIGFRPVLTKLHLDK